MAQTFEYIDTQGQARTIQAQDAQTAISSAQDRAPTSGVRLISADQIESTQPVNIPPVPTSQAGAIADQEVAQARTITERERQEMEATQAQRETDKTRQALMSSVQETEDVMRSRPRLEEEMGLPETRLEVAELTSQIEAREHAMRREIEAVERTAGLSLTQMQRLQTKIQREGARELADMSIVLNSKLRRQEALEASIDRRIKLDLEPMMFRLQFEQMFYQENREILTKSQDRAFQLRLQEEERFYQEQLQERQQIGQIMLTAAQYGATASDLSVIGGAKTWEEAIAKGGEFLGAGFALQVEAQRFTEKIAEANLGISLRKLQLEEGQLVAQQAQQQLSQIMMGSLFSEVTTKEDFITQKKSEIGLFGPPTVDQLNKWNEEYNAISGVDKGQQIAYMVATGMLNPQQANFLQDSLRVQTPDQLAKQKMTIQRGQTVLRDVNRALGRIENSKLNVATGATGALTRFIPGLSAWRLQQDLDSVKSNISIDQLQAMREASPTGGALGQIPVQQQEYLMSVLGSLQVGLEPSVLSGNLNDVYNIYLDAMFGSPQELQEAVRVGRITNQEANSYLQQRKSTSFNEFNLPIVSSQGQDITNYVIAPNGDLVLIR